MNSGKQAVVVMSCENEHMPDDLIMEPGLVMIFAHGVEWPKMYELFIGVFFCTVFLISILLWWHFFMMYVFVYISFLILNKVFFFDCRMSNDLWYSVINGTLRNWIWDGWQNRRDKVLSHLVTNRSHVLDDHSHYYCVYY